MANGLHQFPFFYQRFLASTIGWSDEQVGAYLRLLLYQFNNGYIPKDLKSISKIAESSRKNWKVLSKKFELKNDEILVNKVMEKVREDCLIKSEKNKLNGYLGGRPKKQTVIIEKPNGYENNNPNESQPVTNNQIPKTSKQAFTNKIIEILHQQLNANLYSENAIRSKGAVIAESYFDKPVYNLPKLIASCIVDFKPDIQPKKMQL